jgi:hypothetical protein
MVTAPSGLRSVAMPHAAISAVPGGIAIADDAEMGVHITRLLPDGSWRDRGDDAKITIGHCLGSSPRSAGHCRQTPIAPALAFLVHRAIRPEPDVVTNQKLTSAKSMGCKHKEGNLG